MGIAALRFEKTAGCLFVSLFGAIVTYGFFRWELHNNETCVWLRARAADIEKVEFGLTRGQFEGRAETARFLRHDMGKHRAHIPHENGPAIPAGSRS